MSNMQKGFLTVGLVVLAGFGLFTINALFTVPTVMAMPWNGGSFDVVGRVSESGLLKKVRRGRGSVRNSSRGSRGRSSRRSSRSRGRGATTGRDQQEDVPLVLVAPALDLVAPALDLVAPALDLAGPALVQESEEQREAVEEGAEPTGGIATEEALGGTTGGGGQSRASLG